MVNHSKIWFTKAVQRHLRQGKHGKIHQVTRWSNVSKNHSKNALSHHSGPTSVIRQQDATVQQGSPMKAKTQQDATVSINQVTSAENLCQGSTGKSKLQAFGHEEALDRIKNYSYYMPEGDRSEVSGGGTHSTASASRNDYSSFNITSNSIRNNYKHSFDGRPVPLVNKTASKHHEITKQDDLYFRPDNYYTPFSPTLEVKDSSGKYDTIMQRSSEGRVFGDTSADILQQDIQLNVSHGYNQPRPEVNMIDTSIKGTLENLSLIPHFCFQKS